MSLARGLIIFIDLYKESAFGFIGFLCTCLFIIIFYNCLLLINKNAMNFVIIPISTKHVTFPITFRSFPVKTTISAANTDIFTSSFSIFMTLISFSYFIAWPSTPSVILIRLGDNGHPCLVLNFKGNVCLLRILCILGLRRGIVKLPRKLTSFLLLAAQHVCVSSTEEHLLNSRSSPV